MTSVKEIESRAWAIRDAITKHNFDHPSVIRFLACHDKFRTHGGTMSLTTYRFLTSITGASAAASSVIYHLNSTLDTDLQPLLDPVRVVNPQQEGERPHREPFSKPRDMRRHLYMRQYMCRLEGFAAPGDKAIPRQVINSAADINDVAVLWPYLRKNYKKYLHRCIEIHRQATGAEHPRLTHLEEEVFYNLFRAVKLKLLEKYPERSISYRYVAYRLLPTVVGDPDRLTALLNNIRLPKPKSLARLKKEFDSIQ